MEDIAILASIGPTCRVSPFPAVVNLFFFGVGGGGASNLGTKPHSSQTTHDTEAKAFCQILCECMNHNEVQPSAYSDLYRISKMIILPKRAIDNGEYIAVFQAFRLLHWYTIDAGGVH